MRIESQILLRSTVKQGCTYSPTLCTHALDGTCIHTMLAKHTDCKLCQVMGPYFRTFAMNQIFFRSALTWSSCLAIDVVETSSTLTDPAILAFWAPLQCTCNIYVWTLHIARAYGWELGIVAGVCMSHLGNFFTCLLGVNILHKFFLLGQPRPVLPVWTQE